MRTPPAVWRCRQLPHHGNDGRPAGSSPSPFPSYVRVTHVAANSCHTSGRVDPRLSASKVAGINNSRKETAVPASAMLSTPTPHQVKQAWKRTFPNARAIRHSADEHLGLETSPYGITRKWAAMREPFDADTYAKVMLNAAYSTSNPLDCTNRRFRRPAGSPQLAGGVSPLKLWRGIVISDDDLDEFEATHTPGAHLTWSLAAATPSRHFASSLCENEDATNVLYEIAPGAWGVGVAVDEFVCTGTYQIRTVTHSRHWSSNRTPLCNVTVTPVTRVDADI